MRRARILISIVATTALCTIVHGAQGFRVAQGAPASQPSKATLDGTRWSVKVTPDDAAVKKGEKSFDDILMFADGKVSMSECVKYGFAPSSYKVTEKDDSWAFETHQKSAKEGTTVWEGAVKAGRVRGTMKWTKTDGTVLSYTFEGVKAS